MAERWTASKNPFIIAAVIVVVLGMVAYKAWQRHTARQVAPPARATTAP